MPKHTAGPWTVARIDDETAFATIETVERGEDVPERGYLIAHVSGSSTFHPDADLIAAAPDLLAACVDAANQLDSGLSRQLGSDAMPGHCDYVSKRDASKWCARLAAELRDQIRRARGES